MFQKFIHNLYQYKLYRWVFFSVLALFIFLISKHLGMFWDNVLFVSRMGNELFKNGLFNWYIPDSFDPGHPPFIGFINAIAWKIFGHHLWVSHLAMIPFSIGLFYQLYQFVSYYFEKAGYVFFGFLFLLVDPTLSAQLVLVNPEVPTIFFFFMAVNGLLRDKPGLKTIGLFFLSIITFRSMMLAAGVFIFDVLNHFFIKKEKLSKLWHKGFILPYFIGSIPGLSFVAWRLLTKGWLQTHPDSPWADLWHIADLEFFLRNIIVLIHRYADFGRIFILSFLLISAILLRKKMFNKNVKQLFLLAFSSVFVVVITSLLATNTMGHRYFIVSYLVLALIAFYILIQFYKRKKLIYSILIIALLSGNLWIYPRDIAQGWDASLAHMPYFKLRERALKYMEKNNIPLSRTATYFPNATPPNNVDLEGNLQNFETYNATNTYFFYSNVYNLTDEMLQNLDENYHVIKQFNRMGIYIYIYQLNENSETK